MGRPVTVELDTMRDQVMLVLQTSFESALGVIVGDIRKKLEVTTEASILGTREQIIGSFTLPQCRSLNIIDIYLQQMSHSCCRT